MNAGEKIMKEFVALKPKLYSFLMDEGKEAKKAKGVKKNVVEKEIQHDNFKRCLLTGKKEIRKQIVIRSREHNLFTEEMEKIALSGNDDKRVVLENEINTLAIGHWRLGNENVFA